MARDFSTEVERTTLHLPLNTKRQIKALMTNTNQDARDIVIQAVAAMWREHFEDEAPGRDLAAELDELKVVVERLMGLAP